MNKANLVGVHEAGIAHHVAAIGKVNRQDRAAAILDSAGAMVVEFFVIMRVDVPAGEHLFVGGRNFKVVALLFLKWPWIRKSFTIQTSPSRSIIWALISPTFS